MRPLPLSLQLSADSPREQLPFLARRAHAGCTASRGAHAQMILSDVLIGAHVGDRALRAADA